MRIGVIGAGHAGVEAAGAAAASGAQVTLFSAEPVMPYFRPRLVALAFGQVELDAIRIHPEQWYRDRGITLSLNSPVTSYDAASGVVTSKGQAHSFDGVIISTGAMPVIPSFAAAVRNNLLPLWSQANAIQLRTMAGAGKSIVVVGGGAIGIEAALRASDVGMRVVMVESRNGLMAGRLAPAVAKALSERLLEKRIRILTARSVKHASDVAGGRVLLVTGTDDGIEADIVLLCIGSIRDLSVARQAGLGVDTGILVDDRLQTDLPNVFACGDVVQVGGRISNSAREAVAQGRIAGANICAALSHRNKDMLEYVRPTDLVSLKHHDCELHVAGLAANEGCEIELLAGSDDRTCRAIITRNGNVAGVQMMGTGLDFQKYAAMIRITPLGPV